MPQDKIDGFAVVSPARTTRLYSLHATLSEARKAAKEVIDLEGAFSSSVCYATFIQSGSGKSLMVTPFEDYFRKLKPANNPRRRR